MAEEAGVKYVWVLAKSVSSYMTSYILLQLNCGRRLNAPRYFSLSILM